MVFEINNARAKYHKITPGAVQCRIHYIHHYCYTVIAYSVLLLLPVLLSYISHPDSSWAPGVFYKKFYFYNHVRRLRLEKLLYLELPRSSNEFFFKYFSDLSSPPQVLRPPVLREVYDIYESSY
jgi:hypothetical protein